MLYGDVENGIANGIAVEVGNTVYIVDTSIDDEKLSLGLRYAIIFNDDKLKKESIRRINDDAISKGYISDGLSAKFGNGYDNGKQSGWEWKSRTELSVDNGQSQNNESGISQSNELGRRGVNNTDDTIIDDEVREFTIRRTNYDAVANGYISDGLSSRFRNEYVDDRFSNRGWETRTELSVDQRESEHIESGISQSDELGRRGVSNTDDTIIDDEVREFTIRRTNYDAVANGYISDGLSSRFRNEYVDDRFSNRGWETRKELSVDKRESEHIESGISQSDELGRRGVNNTESEIQESKRTHAKQDLDSITKTLYNHHAWATNELTGILSPQEIGQFNASIGQIKNGAYFPQTIDGKYLVEVGDYKDGERCTIILTDGKFNGPSIEAVYKIFIDNQETTTTIKELIYARASKTNQNGRMEKSFDINENTNENAGFGEYFSWSG